MEFADAELTLDGFLGGEVKILQPRKGYRAGIDSVLLAASVPAVSGDSVLDLGCGAGTAAICLGRRVPGLTISGLELQREYATLARRNSILNNQRFEILEGDVGNPPAHLKRMSFDHVVANPPYFLPDQGTASPISGKNVSRRLSEPLSVWIDCALRRLAEGGWLTIVLLAERIPALLSSMDGRTGSIVAKPIYPHLGGNAGRFVVRAQKSSEGAFRVAHPLLLHNEPPNSGDRPKFTAEAERVLRGCAALDFQ